MGVQVGKLLLPHRYKLFEVAQIGPFCQASRSNARRSEPMQQWLRDAVLDNQLNAIVKLRDDDIDAFLGRELILTHDALQGSVNLLELSLHRFSASVSRLQIGKCLQGSAPRYLQTP